jgi:hypothetical protein
MTTGGDPGPAGARATGPSEPTRTTQAPTVPPQYAPTAATHPDVLAEAPPAAPGMRRDIVRWGPIWAGAIIALATYVVLQLFFFAVGVLDPGFGRGPGAVVTTVVSAVLALVAFFVGGLVAGATGVWTGRQEGLLQGVAMWALTVVGILAVTVIGGGALLGAAAAAAAQVGEPPPAEVDAMEVLGTARNAAGWSALGLGLSVLTAALGGMVGSRMRPQGTRAGMTR